MGLRCPCHCDSLARQLSQRARFVGDTALEHVVVLSVGGGRGEVEA